MTEEAGEGIETWLCVSTMELLWVQWLVCTQQRTNPHKAWSFLFLVYQSNWWGCFFYWKKKNYRGALAVSCLFISHTVHAYVSTCVSYLHTGTKNVIREMLPVLCLSIILYIILENGEWTRIRPTSLTNWSRPHVYCYTFQRSVYDWSASFVCTPKAEEGHLSVLNILCS